MAQSSPGISSGYSTAPHAGSMYLNVSASRSDNTVTVSWNVSATWSANNYVTANSLSISIYGANRYSGTINIWGNNSTYNTNDNPSGSFTITRNDAFTISFSISCGWLGANTGGTRSASGSVSVGAGPTPPAQVHTIVFDANGGTVHPISQTKTYGYHFYVPIPERFGYRWTGWKISGDSNNYTKTSSSSGGTEYTADQDGGSKTMVAQWAGGMTTIKFNANGGSGTMPNQLIVAGAAGTNVLTAAQQNFANWTAIGNTNGARVEIYGPTPGTYATNVYKVSTKGGDWENVRSPAISVTTNTQYTLSCHYKFYQDWNWSLASDHAQNFGGFGITAMSGIPTNSNPASLIFGSGAARAEFIPSNSKGEWHWASVTFTPTTSTIYLGVNGGAIADNLHDITFFIKDLRLEKNSLTTIDKYPVPLNPNLFTRTGYTFKGWATSATGAVVYQNCQEVQNLGDVETINLYAVWEQNSTLLGKPLNAWVKTDASTWRHGHAYVKTDSSTWSQSKNIDIKIDSSNWRGSSH